MIACPAPPPGGAANYQEPPMRTVPSDEAARQLAVAWACLAAVRGPPFCERRVTVLRPFRF